MKIYFYDSESKEFLEEREAFLDPVRTKREGKEHYLVPRYATTEEPKLLKKKGFSIVWSGKAWAYAEDHRGEEVWKKDTGERVTVNWLGEIGDEYMTTEPPKPALPPPTVEELNAKLQELTRQLAGLQAEKVADPQDAGETHE